MVSGSARHDPIAPAGAGGWGIGYSASKAAFARVAGGIEAEFSEQGVRAFNVDPGNVVTEKRKALRPVDDFEAGFGSETGRGHRRRRRLAGVAPDAVSHGRQVDLRPEALRRPRPAARIPARPGLQPNCDADAVWAFVRHHRTAGEGRRRNRARVLPTLPHDPRSIERARSGHHRRGVGPRRPPGRSGGPHHGTRRSSSSCGRPGPGIRRIETVSFVNPERVPKMADADAVMAALHADGTMADLGADSIGLVLNRRGFDRAVDTGVDEVTRSSSSPTRSPEANQGRDSAGLLAGSAEIVEGPAPSAPGVGHGGCRVRLSVRGRGPDRRLAWARPGGRLAPDEIALADSIGVATPRRARAGGVARDVIGDAPSACAPISTTPATPAWPTPSPRSRSGCRCSTRRWAGVGGLPVRPRATGNIPTEDLVYLLHRMGESDRDRPSRVVRRRRVDREALAIPFRGSWPRRASSRSR